MEEFKPGEEVIIRGAPQHVGLQGKVVDLYNTLGIRVDEQHLIHLTDDKLRWDSRCTRFDVRPGLVPVFIPEFKETLWWWFSPIQLEKVK